jgi:dihydroxyacid dehydratase/phosphogluconate dehydratase
MSGTSDGTVVLHGSPEAAVGGPPALVRDGDDLQLDIPNRRLTLRVPDEELARRRAAGTPRPPRRCGSRTAPGRATRKHIGDRRRPIGKGKEASTCVDSSHSPSPSRSPCQ